MSSDAPRLTAADERCPRQRPSPAAYLPRRRTSCGGRPCPPDATSATTGSDQSPSTRLPPGISPRPDKSTCRPEIYRKSRQRLSPRTQKWLSGSYRACARTGNSRSSAGGRLGSPVASPCAGLVALHGPVHMAVKLRSGRANLPRSVIGAEVHGGMQQTQGAVRGTHHTAEDRKEGGVVPAHDFR